MIIKTPKTTMAVALLLALIGVYSLADTNTPPSKPDTAKTATVVEAEATNAPHVEIPKPIKLLSPAALQPQWKTVYILPATVGMHLSAVRVGTNILPNVLLVVADRLDIERLQRAGYQAGQADIEIIQQVK